MPITDRIILFVFARKIGSITSLPLNLTNDCRQSFLSRSKCSPIFNRIMYKLLLFIYQTQNKTTNHIANSPLPFASNY